MKMNFNSVCKGMAFWVGCLVLPFACMAQRDSVPHIVAGLFDWAAFKQQVKAPQFQQNDLAIYVLRKDSLGELISQEENSNWIRDWHFIDINDDRYVDAFYSGATKAKKGFYTYFMRCDTGMRFPIKLAAPGYVHSLKPSKMGVEFILRDDAQSPRYLHTVSEYFFSFSGDTISRGWQLQMVSTTDVPQLGPMTAIVLKAGGQLRTSPKVTNEPPMDYNGDGKPEMVGNVVANLAPGLRGYRTATREVNGEKWSFIVLLDTPKPPHVFQPIDKLQMGYAGWVLDATITGGTGK